MSKVLINQYYTNIQRATQYGKSKNETAIRNHTWNLLNAYAHKKNYEVIPEISCLGTKGKNVFPDGVLRNNWGLDIGYWESKDEKDKIEDEIDAKIRKGYPLTNILFEDSQNAVLYQYGQKIMQVSVSDSEQFDIMLDRFIEYKSETVHKFEKALENFKIDIPVIIETLRKRIEQTGNANPEYLRARDNFLELCKTVINPEITLADIREMMIQHLLTSDIFNKIFDEPEFHRHNSVARELENLIGTLFTYSERRNLLNSVEHFYDAINSTAASITDHHEKQKFLKVLYENFYKVYNPKAADRLGVVYTPNEIVQFMIHSTDYLLEKHFGKTLADHGVEILDPAVGTGTFICDIIEHIPKQHLISKYKNELHANEVAILPYYIANLNIEYAFKQKMGYFEEFPNICFVDTLDNIEGLSYKGQQHSLFGLSNENAERINRQNQKKISVIIGNPPYNANQKNENEKNKNREYPFIDKRIKDTYIKLSTAQKPKGYDMYARFYRWASDRIDKNGIIAFITNRSFIDSRTFDGFRRCIQNEFSHAYIIDLGGDIRSNMGSGKNIGNVFGIITGVSIMFLIKNTNYEGKCKFQYSSVEDSLSTGEKLEWLRNVKLDNISFENITPDNNGNWIEISNTNFESLLLTIDKANKLSKTLKNNNVLFRYFSNGCVTNRDEWVYDLSPEVLGKKIKYFILEYNEFLKKWQNEVKAKNLSLKASKDLLNSSIDFVFKNNPTIKWSGRLFRDKLIKQRIAEFNTKFIRECTYRPYHKQLIYYDYIPIDIQGQLQLFFPTKESNNLLISFNSNSKNFFSLCTNNIVDLHLTGDSCCIPFYYSNNKGEYKENLTDWGLEQFQNHYPGETITKEDIFNYVYAVLHNPAYRKKYELNLKREFPRIPFYDDFRKWSDWGKKLIDLHINFETVVPYDLAVIEKTTEKSPVDLQKQIFMEVAEPEPMFSYQPKIKVKLKAVKEAGIIEIDEVTTLNGIPGEAWEYKLGNRSALEWILDQYKEKKPSDPTIAEKFNTYRFADYKDHVIDLLKRVCTVSIETMKIIQEMESDNSQN